MNRDIAHCRAVLTTHSKSFALAARLLPPAPAQGATAVYAWCRRADDAIDEQGLDSASVVIALSRLRAELGAVYAGVPLSDPVLRAFQDTTRQFAIPKAYAESLLRGMEMDVEPRPYLSPEELLTYCFRVAGTVGVMMCHVMGVRAHTALGHAADLGIAMQLTNICRDVHEDWQRGRLYVPRSLLPRGFRAPRGPGDTLDRRRAEQLRPALKHLLALAEGYYASGDRGLHYLSARSAFAVRTARLVYSAIGEQIAAEEHDVLAGRAVVSGWHKLGLCLRAGWQTLRHEAWSARFRAIPLNDSVQHVAGLFPL